MPKDKRIKGCPNIICVRNGKKYKYKAEDMFCTKCGTALVYVCPECFRKLADEGPEHFLCVQCEAEKEDRKHDAGKRWRKIGDDISTGIKKAGDEIASGARFVGDGVADAAKTTAHAAGNAYKKTADTLKNAQEEAKRKAEEKKLKKAEKGHEEE